MIRSKFVGSSLIALVAVFSNLASFVNTKYLLVEIEDGKVDSKVATSRSFGPARAIDQGKLKIKLVFIAVWTENMLLVEIIFQTQ